MKEILLGKDFKEKFHRNNTKRNIIMTIIDSVVILVLYLACVIAIQKVLWINSIMLWYVLPILLLESSLIIYCIIPYESPIWALHGVLRAMFYGIVTFNLITLAYIYWPYTLPGDTPIIILMIALFLFGAKVIVFLNRLQDEREHIRERLEFEDRYQKKKNGSNNIEETNDEDIYDEQEQEVEIAQEDTDPEENEQKEEG